MSTSRYRYAKFRIFRHKQATPTRIPGEWSIANEIFGGYDLDILTGITWDEMLYTVSAMMISGAGVPRRHEDEESPDVGWSLTVETTGHDEWMLSDGERFLARLQGNEALGFIAAYTLSDRKTALFGGLRSYESHLATIDYLCSPPVALLPNLEPARAL